jgi:hypothetical protein
MSKKKAKTSRSSYKYPALVPQVNLKTRYEEIEDLASYAHTLSEQDKAWLNSYAEEEICANFDHKGEKLNDRSDPKVRSRIYGRNNQRNRCIYTRESAMGTINFLEDIDVDNESKAQREDDFD